MYKKMFSLHKLLLVMLWGTTLLGNPEAMLRCVTSINEHLVRMTDDQEQEGNREHIQQLIKETAGQTNKITHKDMLEALAHYVGLAEKASRETYVLNPDKEREKLNGGLAFVRRRIADEFEFLNSDRIWPHETTYHRQALQRLSEQKKEIETELALQDKIKEFMALQQLHAKS